MEDEQRIVGWKEYVDLPDWGVEGILAKIDTGARTSALHVTSLQEISDGRVRFEVVVSLKDPNKRFFVEADIARESNIKPSSGITQKRYVVETTMRLGGVDKKVQISLASRKNMYCRMLVGRTALEGDFLVDSAKTYLYGKRKKKKKKVRKNK